MRTNTCLQENHLLDVYQELHKDAEERIYEFNFKGWLKTMLQDCMALEFEEMIGVEPYRRDEERNNQRNGFYSRSLHTVFGLIKDLKVPRPRVGGFTPTIFSKYERREEPLNKLITECYWRGISTRDMTYVVEKLTGAHISAAVVSRLTKKWSTEAELWHVRPLEDEYLYIMLDGVWIKNRMCDRKKRLVLVAYGIKHNGDKEIIDYRLSFSESESNWLKFLTNLTARGLSGNSLKLIITDGCKGLENAIDICFPLVKHQLCWAHKMRNIINNVKAEDQQEVKKGLGKIFTEEIKTKAQVMKIIWTWSKQWRAFYPDAVRCLERDLERLLHYLACPVEHHRATRTSNHIERQFKEFRRRMRNMEVLPTRDSAERALYALAMIRNEKLKAYPLEITQKYLH